MKRILPLIVLIALGSMLPLVAADNHSTCSQEARSVCSTLEELGVVSGANVPFIVPSNAVINLSFVNDTHIGYVEVVDAAITQVVCCEQPSQVTHHATVANFAVVEAIQESEQPLQEAQERLSRNEITLEAKRFRDSMRLVVGRAFLRVASWF